MEDIDFLKAVQRYIEVVEVKISGEFGIGETLAELIAGGKMPELYTEVMRRIKETTNG